VWLVSLKFGKTRLESASSHDRLSLETLAIFLNPKIARANASAGSSLVTPEQLPIGLPGVYEEFLERILLDKPPDAWKRIYRPVLGILAVAREPLTFDLLVSLTGITSQDVNEVLNDLKQFLDIGNDPSIDSYRIYHTSFAEFLTTRKQNPTYWIDAASYHWRISDFYLNAWGGLDNSLANLHAPERHDSRDEYGLRYLPAHLEGADRVQDLHRLVRLERRVGEQRENVWYSVKAKTGQLNGYLRDIERAWRQARLNQNVGLQVRYALYLSSVRNLNNIPLPLLEMATRYGVLSWQQALDCSQLYRDPADRAKALVRLIPLLHGIVRDNAIKDALEIAIANQDADILTALVPNLPVALLNDVLELTENIEDESALTKLLLTLTAHVSEQQLGKISEIAGSIDDSLLRVRAWRSIATRLSGDERNEFLEAMNETVNAMPEGADKVQGLCEMAACQEGKVRKNSLDAALLIAGTVEYADNLAVALGALAQQDLTESQIAKSLEIAERTYDTEDHMGTLEMYISVLLAFRKLLSREQRENIITKTVSRLWPTKLQLLEESNGLLAGILGLSLTEDQPQNQFGELVPYLVRGAKSRNYLFGPIRRRTVLTREWKRDAALIVLSRLSKDLIETALQSTARIYNDDDRADILYALVPGLPETRRRKLLAEEVTRVQSFGDKGTKTSALSSLVGYLPTDQRSGFAESLLKEAQTFDEYSFKLTATLAPYLEKHRVDEVIQQALLATAELKESRSRSEALKALSPVLPESRIPQALEIAEGLGIADYSAFAALVPRLKADERHNIIDKCLTAAQGWVAVELPEDFVQALESLAPHMDDSQISTALEICGNIREGQRVQGLVILGPWLSKEQLDEALAIVNQLRPETKKAHAKAALALQLTSDGRSTVLSEGRKALKNTYDQGRIDLGTLSLLLPLMEEDDRLELLSKALCVAKAIDEDDDRAGVLCSLLPFLSGTDRLDAFNQMLESCGGSKVAFTFGGTRFRQNIPRGFLLGQIAGTSGTISRMGGEEVVVEIVRAIRDTAAWWP
jgi:hypothetical protein